MVQDGDVGIERADAPGDVRDVVADLGHVFAVFDANTQDSGHISYGVRDASGKKWFVKTSGDEGASPGGLSRADRVNALELSAEVSISVIHPTLIPVDRIIKTDNEIALVSEWFDGELLRSPRHERTSPYRRFQSLPADEIVAGLDSVIDLHVQLDAAGWTSGDLYDGCLMYDFAARIMKVIDFECYHRGSYVNDAGRLPGSTRFMAPEEFVRGATIDARTTAFTLGRMIETFLLAGHPDHPAREIAGIATQNDPGDRPRTLTDFQRVWRAALSDFPQAARE